MTQYVLADTYSDGRPKYLLAMTAIGPSATPNIDEAERFPTEQAARQSPAYSHWSSFYEPKAVPTTQEGDRR